MISLILALALAARAPLTLTLTSNASAGPTLPPIKGLRKPVALSANVADLVRWSVKDMGQAVVVVEGELGVDLPKVGTGIRVFGGTLSLFKPEFHQPSEIPVAPWMDLTSVGAPGNPAGKMVPLGWGY
jgi:hypothetical protein